MGTLPSSHGSETIQHPKLIALYHCHFNSCEIWHGRKPWARNMYLKNPVPAVPLDTERVQLMRTGLPHKTVVGNNVELLFILHNRLNAERGECSAFHWLHFLNNTPQRDQHTLQLFLHDPGLAVLPTMYTGFFSHSPYAAHSPHISFSSTQSP